jgi:hypothetical protein
MFMLKRVKTERTKHAVFLDGAHVGDCLICNRPGVQPDDVLSMNNRQYRVVDVDERSIHVEQICENG